MSARVLFVCTGNSARSQMAEGLGKKLAAPGVEVASAGTHPAGVVSPLAVQVMRDRGIDISAQRSKRLEDVQGEFDYVITLCDSAAQECPYVPARRARMHWPFPDPGAGLATHEERLRACAQVRDRIEARLREWLAAEGLLGEARRAGTER